MTYLKNKNYSPVPYWCKLPYGMTFKNDATSVSVDSNDNVIMLGTFRGAVNFDSGDGGEVNYTSNDYDVFGPLCSSGVFHICRDEAEYTDVLYIDVFGPVQ